MIFKDFGFSVRSSDKYPNILNVRVNYLSIKNKYDTNLQPINNGLVILKNSTFKVVRKKYKKLAFLLYDVYYLLLLSIENNVFSIFVEY